MIRGRCPTCSKAYEAVDLDALPAFPFCSERCRLVDLGRWIDGRNAIPGPEVTAEAGTGEGDEDDDG